MNILVASIITPTTMATIAQVPVTTFANTSIAATIAIRIRMILSMVPTLFFIGFVLKVNE